MQGQGERQIVHQWRVQITPARYVINNEFQTYEYQTIQKINCNTVNLLNLSILCAFPNFNLDYRQIWVNVLGVEYKVIIPDQYLNNFWSIFDMSSIIQGELNSQTPYVWTINVAGNSNKFVEITCNQPFVLVKSQIPYQNQLARYLGFGNTTGIAYTQPNTNHLSPFPFNVQVTANLNVQIRGVGETNSDTMSCLVQIPIQPVDTYIHWTSPFYQYARNVIDFHNQFPIQRIQVSFLDDNSRPLIINDNFVSMTLLFERFGKE